MSFPGTGKIWMNGTLVDWADANDTYRVARDPLRQRRVRRRALLQHAAGIGVFPARRASAAAVRFREDLPDGAVALVRAGARRHARDDPRQ